MEKTLPKPWALGLPSWWPESMKLDLVSSWLLACDFRQDTVSGLFPSGAVVKNLPANAGDSRDAGSIPGLGRSPGGGNGNLLQDPCLGNPMDRGAWQATFHRVVKS